MGHRACSLNVRHVPSILAQGSSSVPAELRSVVSAHRRTIAAGSLLCVEGDGGDAIYVLTRGWLSIARTMENGQRQMVDCALPGDLIRPGAMARDHRGAEIEALTDASVAVVPGPVWRRLGAHSPDLHAYEARALAAALSRMSDRMLRLGKGSAEQRIAHALLELFQRLGVLGQARAVGIRLPMSQQQLGDYTGLSSVHVCRTLRKLCQRGAISTSDAMTVRIRDLDTLTEIAGMDASALSADRAAVA